MVGQMRWPRSLYSAVAAGRVWPKSDHYLDHRPDLSVLSVWHNMDFPLRGNYQKIADIPPVGPLILLGRHRSIPLVSGKKGRSGRLARCQKLRGSRGLKFCTKGAENVLKFY